jgi:hypothetical protein
MNKQNKIENLQKELNPRPLGGEGILMSAPQYNKKILV